MSAPVSQGSAAAGLARFDARTRRGEHFRWAAPIVGIECRAQSKHHLQILWGKQLRHEIDLLDTDAMFPSNASTAAQAFFKDFMASAQHALDLISVAFVEQ